MKYLTILLVSLLLAGCGMFSEKERPVEQIVVQSQPINRPTLNLPSIDQHTARPVEIIAVTPDNVEEVMVHLEETERYVAFYAMTPEFYENWEANKQERLKIILQQQAVIRGYHTYYTETDNNIRRHNENAK